MNWSHIVLVEDEVKLAQQLQVLLRRQGYEVTWLGAAEGAAAHIERLSPGLILLDLMLPGADGLSVCRQVRHRFKGFILVLTARDEDEAQIQALEQGADDYVVKPVQPRLLLARMHALLRRRDPPRRHLVGWEVDEEARDLKSAHGALGLNAIEFSILLMLMQTRGAVSRDALFERVLGRSWDGLNRTIDVHVSKLRQKLPQGVGIESLRGVGYTLEVAGDE